MTRLLSRVPPLLLVLTAVVSVQFGSSLAKGLFVAAPPLVAAWLRITGAALLTAAIFRPRLKARSSRAWKVAIAYAICLAGMNSVFYLAIQRVPVGMAVTFEFLGPLTVAVLTSRRGRDLVWVALAGGGVALLGFSPEPLDPLGIFFALVAGAFWGCYILLSSHLAANWEGFSGLTVGFGLGAIALVVPAIVTSLGSTRWFHDPGVIALGVMLGLLSSAIPYGLELRALERMPRATFGILMSLEPAAAAVVAWLWLGESLGIVELAAMGMVIAASSGTVLAKPET